MKLSEIKASNPFYGNGSLLNMYNTLSKEEMVGVLGEGENIVFALLNNAYSSIKTEEERQLFFIILFSVGDIANREHNVLKSTMKSGIQAGGSGHRRTFRAILRWMLDKDQAVFYNNLDLIHEYSVIENLFYYQLRTKKNKVLNVEKIPVDTVLIADYIAGRLRVAKDKEKVLWSKFLSMPRSSKRKSFVIKDGIVTDQYKKRNFLEETILRQNFKSELLLAISDRMNWSYKIYSNKPGTVMNVKFEGYRLFRQSIKENLLNWTESQLFSQGKVMEMDEVQFHDWLDVQPAGARFRVKTKLFDKEGNSTKRWLKEGIDIADWYN